MIAAIRCQLFRHGVCLDPVGFTCTVDPDRPGDSTEHLQDVLRREIRLDGADPASAGGYALVVRREDLSSPEPTWVVELP